VLLSFQHILKFEILHSFFLCIFFFFFFLLLLFFLFLLIYFSQENDRLKQGQLFTPPFSFFCYFFTAMFILTIICFPPLILLISSPLFAIFTELESAVAANGARTKVLEEELEKSGLKLLNVEEHLRKREEEWEKEREKMEKEILEGRESGAAGAAEREEQEKKVNE
jgi:hypothetical protein